MRSIVGAIVGLVLATCTREALAQDSKKLDRLSQEIGATIDNASDSKQALRARRFNPLQWSYSFDGTDAKLNGHSVMPGTFSEEKRPTLFLTFDCSTHWVRVSLSASELSEQIARNGISLRMDGDERIRFDHLSARPIAVSTKAKPDLPLVRDVSKLTRDLFHKPAFEIRLQSPLESIAYRMNEGFFPHLESRTAIAQFRERCATFWPDF